MVNRPSLTLGLRQSVDGVCEAPVARKSMYLHARRHVRGGGPLLSASPGIPFRAVVAVVIQARVLFGQRNP